jgi:putative membrane protein
MRYYVPPEGPWHHGLWWVFGGLIPLLFFAALVGLAIWAVLRLSHRPTGWGMTSGPPAVRPDGALEVVRSRYARGEITREEFLQLSTDLGSSAAGWSPPAPPPDASSG